jgi:deoxycytidylate deaminase
MKMTEYRCQLHYVNFAADHGVTTDCPTCMMTKLKELRAKVTTLTRHRDGLLDVIELKRTVIVVDDTHLDPEEALTAHHDSASHTLLMLLNQLVEDVTRAATDKRSNLVTTVTGARNCIKDLVDGNITDVVYERRARKATHLLDAVLAWDTAQPHLPAINEILKRLPRP